MNYPKLLASDIEAKGFYERVNTKDDIHCFCSVDVETDEVYLFHDYPQYNGVKVVDPYDNKEYVIPVRKGSLEEGLKFWEAAAKSGSKLIIHNAHTYDRIIINKIWPNNTIPFDAYWDTFVQSKVQWFERPNVKGAKSPHGLKAYGIKSGVNKPEVTDWEDMDAFKLHRVVEDCRIQKYTYQYLEKERLKLLDKYGINFLPAIKIDSLYANDVALQEIDGAKVDVEHIKRCIVDLDEKVGVLTEEIEPQLPPTVRAATPKLSRKEIAEKLGYNPDKVNDTYVQRKRDGQVETVVEKPYANCSVNYTVKKKTTLYQGFHISYGESPEFSKKKSFTDWRNTNFPKTKPSEWDIEKVVKTATLLNKSTCEYFGVEEDSDLIAGPFTKVKFEPSRMTQNEVVKGFVIKLGWKEADEWNLKEDFEGNYIKIEVPTEVRWPARAAPENQMVKELKRGDFMVSSPKLSEKDYEQLPEGLGQKIAEYNTYQHRRRFLSNPKDPENKGLLSFVRPDGRIPCGLNNFGTATGRSTHRVWVNAPGEKSLYGKEVRKSIVAGEGKKLVGIDQKSSQLSIAAMFARNSEYYDAVASGSEEDEQGNYLGESAHCYSARNFGIVSKEEWKRAVEMQEKSLIESISLRRSFSKGASFGVIFGCSGAKLAGMLGVPEKEGNTKKNAFLKQMGLDEVRKYLLETCKTTYAWGGGFYIPLAFGYWVWCKQDHKAINYLVQGTEALAQKLAEIRCRKEFERLGISNGVKKIISYQDEYLFECDENLVDKVSEIGDTSFSWAAEQIFEWYVKHPDKFPNSQGPLFKIDLAGGAKVGTDYSAVH